MAIFNTSAERQLKNLTLIVHFIRLLYWRNHRNEVAMFHLHITREHNANHFERERPYIITLHKIQIILHIKNSRPYIQAFRWSWHCLVAFVSSFLPLLEMHWKMQKSLQK